MMFQDAPKAKNGPVEITIKLITRLFNQAKKAFPVRYTFWNETSEEF